jgi:ABC-type amino acid transport system permease subunit
MIIFVAIVYFSLSFALSYVVKRLQKRIAIKR